MRNMKLVVIGSNSFSGASFVRYALDAGAEVIGISRSPEPHRAFLPYRWRPFPSYRFLQLDLNRDLSGIMEAIEGFRPECVVNFAAQSMVAQSWEHPEDWFMTNTVSSVKLHDRLRHCDFLDKYVHISTPEVYGNCQGNVTEDAPFHPSTPYAVSRAACDMSLKTFFDAYRFPVVFTRAANVYGPGQQLYRIIPRTILFARLGRKLQLHGGGQSVRSFIHMRDVSDATYKIAQHGVPGEVYHLSTARALSIRDVVAMILTRMGLSFEKHVEIVGERLGKDAAYLLDSSKARRTLGWHDQIGLEQGIDETIAWVDENLDALREQPMDYVHKK